MVTVVVSPSGLCGKNIISVKRCLEKSGCRVAACCETADFDLQRTELLLVEAEHKLPKTLSEPCIVVLFENCDCAIAIPNEATVLAFCDAGGGACKGGGRQLLSCGLHSKDTITLSSLEKGKPVLSVQRQIKALDGNYIEIGEYPLLYDGENYRALIAAAAIMLLCKKNLPPETFARCN